MNSMGPVILTERGRDPTRVLDTKQGLPWGEFPKAGGAEGCGGRELRVPPRALTPTLSQPPPSRREREPLYPCDIGRKEAGGVAFAKAPSPGRGAEAGRGLG